MLSGSNNIPETMCQITIEKLILKLQAKAAHKNLFPKYNGTPYAVSSKATIHNQGMKMDSNIKSGVGVISQWVFNITSVQESHDCGYNPWGSTMMINCPLINISSPSSTLA